MPSSTRKKSSLPTVDVSATQQQSLKRFFWIKSNFVYCLTIAALLWIVGLCYYVEHFIGWSSIFALAPTDFSLLILAVSLPLFFLWFILAYIERSSSLDANALLFRNYIDSLMYPDDEASQNAKAFSVVLQNQIAQMQTESKNVIQQSQSIKKDLEARINDLSAILKLLDNYSAQTLTELNDGVNELANRCTYITDKASSCASNLKECSADISQNADKFLGKLTPVLDEISVMSSTIKNNINDNKNYLVNIKEQLNACADLSQQYVRDMLVKTTENTRNIERSFYKTAEEYDALYKRLDTSISSIEGRVEEQKRLIQSQTQVINHNSELLNNKLSKYGKTVSGEIEKLVKNSVELEKTTKKQIAALKAVNNEAGAAIRGITDVFDEKRMEIERRSEYAINSMQNVIIAINKETDKLMSFTNLTQSKNYDLQHISEMIVDKIGDISNKLALKTDSLKDKAVEVIDKFTQANEIISRSTNKINTSSNLIVTNSKQGVKLLEEQDFYINNVLNNMSIINEKLEALRSTMSETTTDLAHTVNSYEQDVNKLSEQQKSNIKIQPAEPEFDRDKVLNLAKSINRTLRNIGINAEKIYDKQDVFELWDLYLDGNHSAFVDVLVHKLTHKSIQSIRKAFDDNAEFHAQVIRYLFLMDLMIKDLANKNQAKRDELVNFSVNMSLEKIYFILVKALNSAD